MPTDTWTTADFDKLSWHDNAIHGFSFREGPEAVGDLVLDIDFILEWLCDRSSGSCDFRVAPATLTFHEVSDLVLSLDYVTTTAALCAPSIGEITRQELIYPNDYKSFAWTISINWPSGSICFHASGFTQVLRAEAIVASEQSLAPDQRKPISL